MTTPLIWEPVSDLIGLITLNRPERRNALSRDLLEALLCRLDDAERNGSRVLMIQGAGPAFCAGMDLVEAADPDAAEVNVRLIADLYLRLAGSPLITIALAHGAAYAGGAGLMASCDFVLAAESLTVAFPEVRRGLIPALVGVVLSGRLPEIRLRELLLWGEPIDARAAADCGLVNRIVPADSLRSEGLALAGTLLKGAPQAIRATKHHLRQLQAPDFAERMSAALERHLYERNGVEASEGIAAFRERRDPCWNASGDVSVP